MLTIQQRFERANRAELVTVVEFALLTRYAPQTIWRKIKRREIPGVVRMGRSIRIKRAVALAWHERQAAE